MKAKESKRNGVSVPGTYLCQRCDTTFDYRTGRLACPVCKCNDDNLVPVYMEDDQDEEQFYSKIDWHGGD